MGLRKDKMLIAKEKYFVDTNAWIASYDIKDQYHSQATNFLKELLGKPITLITSDYIIDETITFLRMNVSYAKAVNFKESIDQSAISIVKSISDEIRNSAWSIFLKYSDQEFSFTDCTSFALMKDLSLKKAFTFDSHFSIMGFECLPRF